MHKTYNILVVEDEQTVAKRIMRLTDEILSGQVHFFHVEKLEKAASIIESEQIDLLFLDLNLQGQDGFQLLSASTSASFHTIIISAYQEKAITAFEYGVLDFIGKPFSKARLQTAINRWLDKLSRPPMRTKFLTIRKRGSLQLIELRQVVYIKGAGPYAELYLEDGSKELYSKSLDAALQILPADFARIHRSYIVDMGRVNKFLVEQGGKYAVLLENGMQLPVGRTRYKGLVEKLSMDGLS